MLALDSWLPSSAEPVVTPLLPHTPLEIVFWILLSVSAGITEEITFRGYLQRQMHVLTRSAAAAIMIQGVIFGITHGYQGLTSTVRITIYGLMIGVLAHATRSLRAPILMHSWTDIASGVFRV